MSDKNPLSEDDKALFRDAVGDVKSVANDKVPDSTAKPKPRVKSTRQDDRSVMESLLSELSENDLLETGEHLAYTAPGVQRAVLRKLKSGKYAIQGEIDLHGMTLSIAKAELSAFLVECQHRRLLCVRIIHGKGRKQADKAPRMKPAVNQWLQSNKKILAFCSARSNDGGTGAVYALMKRISDS